MTSLLLWAKSDAWVNGDATSRAPYFFFGFIGVCFLLMVIGLIAEWRSRKKTDAKTSVDEDEFGDDDPLADPQDVSMTKAEKKEEKKRAQKEAKEAKKLEKLRKKKEKAEAKATKRGKKKKK